MGKTKMPEIVITVEGGAVQDVKIPEGCNIRVKIKDFDIEGSEADQLKTEKNGDEYVELIYEN